ncbi:MAG: SAM-dependent DNA methyltransferase, partial [Clostridia bacterium]|nr:SAM-dependent DNA methyltransferase [Clostridia bacterium]
MAKRPVFALQKGNLIEKEYEFKWHGGFAASQTKKNIDGLHESYKKERTNSKIIEVSSRSENPDGVKLSAFNLKLKGARIENIFQAAKKFENGGPYKDLLDVIPKEAKRDERLKTSGKLVSFENENVSWPIEPKTAFYDYIYISALIENDLLDSVNKYDAFTDIFFNPEKSINCQARACAISKNVEIVKAIRSGNVEEYLKVHKELTDRVKDSFE